MRWPRLVTRVKQIACAWLMYNIYTKKFWWLSKSISSSQHQAVCMDPSDQVLHCFLTLLFCNTSFHRKNRGQRLLTNCIYHELVSIMCVYSNSCNDVPRVAQWYGTIAAHIRHRASVLVVFVVFLRAHVQYCRFDKTDTTADVQWHCNHRLPLWYHYLPAQSSLGADILVYWIGKNRSDMCPRWESTPRLPACKASTLSTRPGSPLIVSIRAPDNLL